MLQMLLDPNFWYGFGLGFFIMLLIALAAYAVGMNNWQPKE